MAQYRKWFFCAMALGLVATSCGTTSTSQAAVKPHVKPSVKFGDVTLKTGMIWELNSPGDGTPRETITIESLAHHRVRAMVYASEFGTLIETTVQGHLQKGKNLTLTGTVQEASVTGATETLPVKLIVVPVHARTIWVTQLIRGDHLNTFEQIPFHLGIHA
ncbi:MAG: hypothetical protein C7B45_03280 [Sulfobacillus acidophilus]|uniref:Uncharacterized protein n=1 Tax=Sulfobacillus acidophilus TaxID=53633 RepID=A0A2T2WM93_9FIRM|nr:MAG: hypothetical protein C7B45_03280 [Sulfobacillus acidophilus]